MVAPGDHSNDSSTSEVGDRLPVTGNVYFDPKVVVCHTVLLNAEYGASKAADRSAVR